MELEHHTIATNGINLQVVQAGAPDGKLIILLHGYPEFWYGWHEQIEALVAAGYRVWVPDQRGYNLSDKPKGVAAYSWEVLSQDIIGLIKAAGHDWGAAVAWWLGANYPQYVEKLIIVNVPHHKVFGKAIRQNPVQRRRSWYMFVFQIPFLPEQLLRLNRWWLLTSALKRDSRPGTFSEDALELYREAWSQPGAMTAMINWYRASARFPQRSQTRITVPTLMLWGKQDKYLGAELAQPSIELCDEGRLIFFEAATHWILHEMPEKVNAALLDFLK